VPFLISTFTSLLAAIACYATAIHLPLSPTYSNQNRCHRTQFRTEKLCVKSVTTLVFICIIKENSLLLAANCFFALALQAEQCFALVQDIL
jgi:hypothetical protein